MTQDLTRTKAARFCLACGAVATTTSLWLGMYLATYAQSATALPRSSNVQVAQNSPVVNRFQTLAEADELYKKGQLQAAENLYRKVKPPFPPAEKRRQAIYELEQLPSDGQVYWRNANEGLQQNLDSKIFLSLQRLTENYPEFIKGHLLFAEACQKKPEACQANAKDGQPKKSIDVLERATDLYPDEPDLLKAKIKAFQSEERFLEAAITARQFAAIYPDYEEASEFTRLADENMKRHQSKLREELRTQGIMSAVIGGFQAIVTQNWQAGLSGLQTLMMLGEGESKFGKAFADKYLEQYKEQQKLVEDPQVLNYVKGIAGRLTPLFGRDFEYEFYIVEDNSINAFALPGGKVFINTGAILATNSEAELAGLLSHEISHTVLAHGFQSVAQSNLLGNLKKIIPMPDILEEMIGKQHSREQERQADILGTRVLSKAGYAADGVLNLMQTLNEQSGGKERTTWKSTHPAPAERVEYIQSLIQSNGYNRYAYEGVKTHQDIQNILRGTPVTEETTAPQPTNSPPKKPTATKVGTVALNSSQTRDSIEIRLDAAQVKSARDFTIKFTIENRSNSAFGFVPLYAQVVDENGKALAARFSSVNGLIPPGGTMQGEVRVTGYPWNSEGTQNLNLVIKESTSGGRLFRVAF